MTSYIVPNNEPEKINQARAKAFIHLFLKATHGILDFNQREEYITDGTHDGGIDAYYIDQQLKCIFFIQSKFRTTENNFENKDISIEELLKMDIDRILKGESTHENGIPYNSRIAGMQNKMKEISDIARFRYEVVILANLKKISDSKIRLLTTGLPYQIFDFKKTFSDLVFPVVCGTFYNYSDLCINVNLSNKSSGAHINYTVETGLGNCDITVLFIPLDELGKLMYEYKNSILKFNPRSYLTLKEGSINDEIRQTIITKDTNEFALFNNGITILSDETFFNQRIGQKDKAQLSIKNPQIINGGQTAFTISLVYEESLTNEEFREKLLNKEVLVKIITFSLSKTLTPADKLELIESISDSTNKQNPVNGADRSSNNPLLIASQKALFNDFGLLLERKRGEFFDGLRYQYVEKSQIIDRGIFMRIAFSCLGYPVPPKKEKQLLTDEKIDAVLNESRNFKRYFFGCLVFSELQSIPKKNQIAESLSSGFYAIIAVSTAKYYSDNLSEENLKRLAKESVERTTEVWQKFEEYAISQFHNAPYFNYNFNFYNKTYRLTSKFSNYFRSQYLSVDLNDFFFEGKKELVEANIRQKILTIEKYLYIRHLNLEIIEKIRPLINPTNWFDEKSVSEIVSTLGLEARTVKGGIKFITSKEFGYYVADKKESTGANTVFMPAAGDE